jgi:tetratricopeptide (TPR) repeat protein
LVLYNNYTSGLNDEAAESMWKAEYYFEVDSLDLALNGDNNYPGFLEVADNYGGTETGGLAKYYIASIYMKKGDYSAALQYFEESEVGDDILSVMRVGGMGDAQMELGNAQEAADLFERAATMNENDFTTPMYLMKAGYAYKQVGNFEKAASSFSRVAADFPLHADAAIAEKYAALYSEL